MITKATLDAKLKLDIAGITDVTEITKRLIEHTKYAAEHYDELDEESKAMVDGQIKLLEEMNDQAITFIKEKPDSLEKRQMVRAYRQVKGSHMHVGEYFEKLEKEQSIKGLAVVRAREVFDRIGQYVLDFLCDATEKSHKGGTKAVKLALLYAALEEAFTAFYLASRGFAPQSMAHTRNISQAVDLVSVFQKHPNHVHHWSSDDYKEREKVSPKNVRKLLGKDEFQEQVYWTLSDFGSHPSFKYLQTKVMVRADDRAAIRITMGGVSDQFHTRQAMMACLGALIELLAKIVDLYEDRLLASEIEAAFKYIKENMHDLIELQKQEDFDVETKD